MSTAPNPATGALRIPPAVQSGVIALRTAGKSKREIAKELGINRRTVDNVLGAFQTDAQQRPVSAPNYAAIVQDSLVPKAIARLEQVLPTDTSAAQYVLDNTLFRRTEGNSYTVNADNVLMSGIDMMPLKSTPSLAAPATGTEAGANPTPNDISLSSRTNFSQNLAGYSTAELEAELERRRRG